jgi:hypothetical protein
MACGGAINPFSTRVIAPLTGRRPAAEVIDRQGTSACINIEVGYADGDDLQEAVLRPFDYII